MGSRYEAGSRVGRRRIAVILSAILLVVGLAAMWSFTRMDPSPSPGARSGFHVVDGYNLGPESPCTAGTHVDPSASLEGRYRYGSSDFCDAAVAAATPLLLAKVPGATILKTAVAPPSCGDPYIICTLAALGTPLFAVFDLADGSRQAIELRCMGPTIQGSSISPVTCGPEELKGLPFFRPSAAPSD